MIITEKQFYTEELDYSIPEMQKVKELFLKEQYSRLPVYEKTVDHIVGVITQHDFFERIEKSTKAQKKGTVPSSERHGRSTGSRPLPYSK